MPILADQDAKTVDKRALKRTSPEMDQDTRWWLASDEDMHERVWMVADRIAKNLSGRRRTAYMHALMYNDVDPVALYSASGEIADRGGSESSTSRITLNVVQNAIDTAASLVAKNRPKPLFLTDGGSYPDYLKAQRLTKFVAGVFDDARVYEKAERVFTDGGVYGTGAIKFWSDPEEGKIHAEWCLLTEILVDDLEGLREKPAQLHQRKYYSRDQLIEMFPDKADKIREASSDVKQAVSSRVVGDAIPVLESWHLKSGPRATDGRHTITIEGATLFSEQYDKDYYPILFWRWYHSTHGFWGRGICHQIGKIQRTINKILRTIDQCQDLLAIPVWMVPKMAMVAWDHLLNNEIGRAVEYMGEQRPDLITPQSAPPELYNHLQFLINEAYQVVGINQGMAQGTKEPGVNSGAGLREVADIASGRLQVVGQRWEQFFTEIALVVVDLAKDLAKEMKAKGKSYSVKVKDDDSLTEIDWADVDMDRDKFKISVFEVSALPTTPAGRLQTISEWLQAGWIPKEMAMSLLNVPDLKRFSSLETGTADLVQKTIGEIKESGRYDRTKWAPIPQMNLGLGMQLATMECVVARNQGLPDSVIEAITLYLEDMDAMMKAQQPPPPPGPPPGPGGPPGGPPGPGGGAPPMQMAPPPPTKSPLAA